ncbi:MAG: hypothetical protein ACOVSW_21990 [Candidatus Kapaibacteriota bacterium]|jgi:hypothetical protein
MSTIQISVSDALAGRIGKEELERLLQEHIERLETETFAAPILQTARTEDTATDDFSLETAIQASRHHHIDFQSHPFIGLWADREDMSDSVEYVRNLRKEMNRFDAPSSARQ